VWDPVKDWGIWAIKASAKVTQDLANLVDPQAAPAVVVTTASGAGKGSGANAVVVAVVAGAVSVGALLAWQNRKAIATYIKTLRYGEKKLVTETYTYSADRLRGFIKNVFLHFEIPEEDADIAADVLITADLRGIDSHGIARLFSYFQLLEAGLINPRPVLKIIRETETTASVDGDNGLGLVVGPKANMIAIQKAKQYGSGWVSVSNTNHYGIAGYYSLEALKHGIIGISMTNTTKLVVPCFGAERMLGTNPIAIAFPGEQQPPIVIDMATSVVAYGKVEEAARMNKEMPEGWCVDKYGQPTTDPARMQADGALLTIGKDRSLGQHKGYCLSAMVDILCCVLSGANWGPFAPPFILKDGVNATDKRVGKGIGHFFGALRIDGFREPTEFKSQIDDWIHCFRNSKAEPGKQVLIPGDPEREAQQEREVKGIPVKLAVIKDMQLICSRIPVKFDFDAPKDP